MSDRWDKHFLNLALTHAGMSKDPSTKVGAVIVGPHREIRAMGFNGFPTGIADTYERLHDREQKYPLMVHAERNAVLLAARVGIPTNNCTLYMIAQDAQNGQVWGGCPCTPCTIELIQAGIKEIVTLPQYLAPPRWHDDTAFASTLLAEANISLRTINNIL